MRICITLDDVIRAKTLQFGKIYKKYKDKDIDLETLDLSSGDFCQIFGFKTENEYKEFLYKDYPFEIFAEASTVEKMVDKRLNLWHMSLNNDVDDDDEIELIISNPREFNFSIGYTCFFLSKIATHVREIYFPKDSSDIWNKCDVLITADKDLLDNTPNGKKSVKIEMPYNMECKSNLSYKSLTSLIDDDEFITKIKNDIQC